MLDECGNPSPIRNVPSSETSKKHPATIQSIMKRILLLAMVVIPVLQGRAQPSPKERPAKATEIGLVFSGLHSFGITFRVGNERALWRLNNVRVNGANSQQKSDSITITRPELGFGLAVGREWRKPIKERFTLRGGADLGYSLNRSIYQQEDISIFNNDYKIVTDTHVPSVNLVLGLNVMLASRLLLGVEVLPAFNYVIFHQRTTYPGIVQESTIVSYNFGMNFSNALLSLVYKIR